VSQNFNQFINLIYSSISLYYKFGVAEKIFFKMTISEKIEHSTPNEVHLFKEGVFWVAYEQSACAICKIKPYKPTKKMIKTVGQEVVSVGFPENALAGILSYFQNTKKEDNIIIMQSETPIEQETFKEWKDGIAIKTDVSRDVVHNVPVGESIVENGILQKIRNFDVSNASPIECMLFINELKQATY
jgi:hypothetical protein